MTTVPIRHDAVGVIPDTRAARRPSPGGQVIATAAQLEAGLKVFLERWSIPTLRVILGLVFAIFGALKFFPGVSPIESLVQSTWHLLSFGLVGPELAMILTASMEVIPGVLLIAGGVFTRIGLVVLAFTFVGILSPIVLLPAEVFGPTGPTLTGQYIFKDAVLIAAALVVASKALRGPKES